MSQQTQRRRDETTFIEPSGGLMTEQLLHKLRDEQCSEDAVKPETFAFPGTDTPSTDTTIESRVSDAWDELVERWDEISRDNAVFKMDTSEVRSKWSRRLFEELGFSPGSHQADMTADGVTLKADYLGWASKEPVQATYDTPDAIPPVLHMVQPDPENPLDDGDHKGSNGKSPHDELQTYLNANSDLQWSVVTDGLKLRLLRDYYHTYTRGYVEFDLENIFTNRNYGDFRTLYRLCHASRFIEPVVADEDDEGETPLERLYQIALSTGVKVGQDLQENVVSALETLGNGFLDAEIKKALEENGQDAAEDYYQDLLYVVYRLLFLMFTEQRGMMSQRDSLYTEEYSITKLRERAEEGKGGDRNVDFWEGLKVTFRLVGEGDNSLGVPGYNGALFDNDNLEFILDAKCPNEKLLSAVHDLTHIEQGGYQQRISYADLGVEEIGAVYESLLEFTPQLAETVIELEDRTITSGSFYLDDRGMERKETGSYYTDPGLVDELIQSSLKPVVEDRVNNDASTEVQEQQLLEITVCDPACGSGAFLIAANNFLGQRLAEIRSDSLYPDERTIRQSRRSVVQHCIYGVDLNPMAVELAKASLWINSAVEDKPLSFLDHRIKQGNSLLGTTPDLVDAEIPVDAYETSSGRKWHIGNELRKRVRKENKQRRTEGNQSLASFGQGVEEYRSLAEELDSIEEDTKEDVHKKERLYKEFKQSETYQQQKQVYDLWTSAFFWPMHRDTPGEHPTPKTIDQVRRDEDLSDDLEAMINRASKIAEKNSFFHWPIEYPSVYNDGGFDCILGNPPWDRVSLEAVEFFAVTAPKIAKAETKSKRLNLIEELKEENPELHEDWENEVQRIDQQTKFFKESGRYPESSKGYVNTYALFAGFATDNVSPSGKAGLVSPTGIATDSSTQDFFRKLVENQRLDSLYGFDNKNRIFQDVHGQFKFCLLVIAGRELPQNHFDLAFNLTSIDQLHDQEKKYQLSKRDISLINPNTKNCPTFDNEEDAELTLKLYQNTGALKIEEKKCGDPWGVNLSVMFNKSNDSGLFYTYEELSEEDLELDDRNRFVSGDEEYLPIYESKFFHQYDHRFATHDQEIDGNDPRKVSTEEKDDPTFSVLPRYWLKKEVYEEKFRAPWHMALRDITRATDERTAICSLLPDAPTVHTMNHILGLDAREAALMMACMNSYTLDYVARQKVGGTHLSQFIIKQLPVPDPSRFEEVKFDGDPIGRRIVGLVTRLACNSDNLDSYMEEVGVSNPYSFSSPKGNQREEIRFELEALICHMYGLSVGDIDQVFSIFEQIQRKDNKEHGYFRTREEIKKRFEELSTRVSDTSEEDQ
ncbi:N-6 DNA methylase [Natronococcus sp. A-GB7]|uniref:Eco57I restriction-modification methylase domain-containing protein n=1 Tax=Natronococcus sp. A-GB7 TaxID=3037649 RepID=UPI00241EAD21|nr:N-6 DNA methylase [Natronococcus sp. A-GB7]MDG5821433.1 N-6 DNA methylase [Natronococcus sp. A-GB7]